MCTYACFENVTLVLPKLRMVRHESIIIRTHLLESVKIITICCCNWSNLQSPYCMNVFSHHHVSVNSCYSTFSRSFRSWQKHLRSSMPCCTHTVMSSTGEEFGSFLQGRNLQTRRNKNLWAVCFDTLNYVMYSDQSLHCYCNFSAFVPCVILLMTVTFTCEELFQW